jgi:hypothetical protein
MSNSVTPGLTMILLTAEMPARAFHYVKSSRSGNIYTTFQQQLCIRALMTGRVRRNCNTRRTFGTHLCTSAMDSNLTNAG